ncbi:MAG TPA: hypothetical protein VES01_04655 [Dermatophilaceae bacterium]|nr:hypothetical protein [Dermatophilaceae bacterium]
MNPTLDTLTPVVAVADLTAEPDRAEFHTLSCGLAKQATKQFGVEHPQLVLDPRSGTPDPGSSSLVSVNPFRCGVDASASAPDRRGGTQAS